jgi:copper chaperone NosL
MIALLLACQQTEDAASISTTPEPIGQAECAVCGMTVAEQPAPRGQLIWRDGTRAHFCSLGELRATVQGPSPHGEPVAVYVETLPADFDPATPSTAPLAWSAAEQAWYLFGAERPGVMGMPVLSYASEAEARQAAERLSLSVASWEAVRGTPFHQAP